MLLQSESSILGDNRALRVAVRRFGPFEAAIQSQFVHFQKMSGSTLGLRLRPFELHELYAATLQSNEMGDGDWDLVFMPTDWLPEAIEEGKLADLTPMIEKDPIEGFPEAWSPILVESQRFRERIYGIPFHDGPECLIYRKDWFEDPRKKSAFEAQFGYPLRAPANWDQFYDAARFFTSPPDGRFGTVFAAFPDGHNTLYDFCLQLWSRGGELLDSDGRICLTQPSAAKALDFYRKIATDLEAVPANVRDLDSVASGELFLRGSVALMVNWFGFAAHCSVTDCPARGNIGVAPIPSDCKGGNATLSVCWVLAIPAGSRRKGDAYAFLKHIVSPEMEKLATLGGVVGCRRATWTDADVNAIIPFFKQLPEFSANSRTLPRTRALPEFANLINELITRAITGSEPTLSLLEQAQRKANRLDFRVQV